MATSYTSDKKIGALDPITGSLSANDETVVNKNGDTLKASMSQVEAFVFGSKTQVSPQTGDVVIVRRGTDIRQLTTENLLPSGSISNGQIASGANIDHSKLANIPSGRVLMGNASNVPTATVISGDVTLSNAGVTAIASGVIVDADINASAAISLSKLATGALPSGITVASANLVDGTIVDADINGSAAIALSKLATGALPSAITVASANIVDGTIVDADINASAAIALSKLANGALPSGVTVASANIVDGTIVNADINASAAIADTKLATISTAAKVSNSATTATSANTANAIVARDASGNFTAGTITATSFVGSGASLTGISSIPSGAVMPFARSTKPSGWLEANGDVVPNGNGTVQGITADFSALYAAVSTSFGAAGTLPDLRGIFVRGSGSQTISGTTYSGTFAAKQQDEFKSHKHTLRIRNPDSNTNVAGGVGPVASFINIEAAETSSVGGTETRPANIALLYCIKI